MNSKYSKLLTIILIVAIIIVVILFVFFGIQIYKQYYVEKQQSDMSEIFDNAVAVKNVTTTPQTPTDTNTVGSNEVVAPIISGEENPTGQGGQTSSGGSSGSSKGIKYKGYTMVGKIEIPKIKADYPILEKTSKGAIEIAVSVLYGPGPNQVGNTVIVGHNYKNGTMFSNNKKLQVGDEIYITDTAGNRMRYIIYDKQLLAPEDFDYASRDTQGAREISLSTCTDDVNSRLVIFAKEG